VIDFHVHLGNCFRDEYPQRTSLTVEQLIDRMNREGIKISVLLPLESPEVQAGYFLTEQAIEARDLYPERLIAFAGVDPRQQKVAQQLDVFINRYGCRGYGELLNPLPFDHELNKVIYGKCDEYGLRAWKDACGNFPMPSSWAMARVFGRPYPAMTTARAVIRADR